MGALLEAFYLPLDGGRRFCLLHSPRDQALRRDAILYVHPFAEEMNKSRRMAALQSRALAAAGWIVLQMDLAGCGDSEGDFADATWQRWVSDVRDAWMWLRERSGRAPWLWGLRAGGLVATEAARRLVDVPGMLFWQPVLSGRQHLQQFLRLKIAAQVFASGGKERVGTSALREQLGRGESIEVGGYTVPPALALGLEAAELAPPPGGSKAVWLEVGGGDGVVGLSPAASARADDWRASGWALDVHSITGEPFWQTQEIAECPALISGTVAALSVRT